MEETLRSHLLELCRRHSAVSGFAISALGKAAIRDHTFFARVSKGDGFNVKTFDRAVLWFSSNWPNGAEWPADVPRPAPTEVAA